MDDGRAPRGQDTQRRGQGVGRRQLPAFGVEGLRAQDDPRRRAFGGGLPVVKDRPAIRDFARADFEFVGAQSEHARFGAQLDAEADLAGADLLRRAGGEEAHGAREARGGGRRGIQRQRLRRARDERLLGDGARLHRAAERQGLGLAPAEPDFHAPRLGLELRLQSEEENRNVPRGRLLRAQPAGRANREERAGQAPPRAVHRAPRVQVPERPPLLRSRPRDSMRMPRSAALSMS
ncbi:MAG: hypothetical protein M5U26_00285 [Planctomycetota bacterium]|nr:hypothetical protein [Planctomycetota bacterium]